MDGSTTSTAGLHRERRVERVCFQLRVDAARLDEYRERHAAVWPDMLRAIEASGRRNYSLFLRDDGLLIGYYEVDDDAVAQVALANDPRTAAWEAEMAQFFVALDGDRPDQSAPRIPEVFHLEDQLAALDEGTGPATSVTSDADARPAASVTTRTESSHS
ncbi:L-rhamnose mutarotase [Agromyces sp. NPDC049794]|uniref:L-rhamnose mutarotase n=1 Tax=unclassified Agromyces TaxID=2639701 RepID=UPI00340EEAA9